MKAGPVSAVLAARKAHGVTVAKAADWNTYPTTQKPAEKALGLAPHATRYMSVILAAGAELVQGSSAWREYGMVAFLDGYALAKHLHGGKSGAGKPVKSAPAFTRYLRTVVRLGPGLLKGPHAETARALIASWKPPEEAAEEVMANGLACGAQLYQHEHGVTLPGLEAAPAKKNSGAAPPAKTGTPFPAELIAAVIAAPKDDGPRLVLADWLSERGDPRGEFISVQCALGRGRFGAEGKWVLPGRAKLTFESRAQLEAREQELLKAHEKAWVAPIRKAMRQWGFKRGFPHRVIADLASFGAAAGAALAQTPLEQAKVTGFKRPQLAALLEARPHPTLEQLDLGMNRLDDAAAPLFSSPLLSRLTALNLEGNPLGAKCLEELSKHGALRRLRLWGGEFDDAALEQLARAPFWKELTGLDLSRCAKLTSSRAVAVLNAAPKLKWLSFNLEGVSDDDLLTLVAAHPALEQLTISSLRVSEAAVKKVLAALPKLKHLGAPMSLPKASRATLEKRFTHETFETLM